MSMPKRSLFMGKLRVYGYNNKYMRQIKDQGSWNQRVFIDAMKGKYSNRMHKNKSMLVVEITNSPFKDGSS